jgi:hypothetical protein
MPIQACVVPTAHNPGVAWWRARCPVRPLEREWIDRSMAWFVDQFGDQRLHDDVMLPNDDYFPGVYRGTPDDVEQVLDRLCEHMRVDRDRVELEQCASDANPELSGHVPIRAQSHGAAGDYRLRGGRPVIGISDDQAAQPMALVATLAHELGHVLLLGDGRITADREDHEPLTDLLTVFYGLGIFAANAAFEYTRDIRGQYGYARTSRLGYLTEPMYGYGLARYAWLRAETAPAWARYLDTNPRAYFKRGLRYLRQADQRSGTV